MKAMCLNEKAEFVWQDVPNPACHGAFNVKIRIRACALNRADLMQRAGIYALSVEGLGDATAADFREKVLAVCPLADRGIYTGERANSSCGVVSVTDVPYRELTEAMKTIAGEMYRRRHGADK